jgi:hypothetical protein
MTSNFSQASNNRKVVTTKLTPDVLDGDAIGGDEVPGLVLVEHAAAHIQDILV